MWGGKCGSDISDMQVAFCTTRVAASCREVSPRGMGSFIVEPKSREMHMHHAGGFVVRVNTGACAAVARMFSYR